MGTLIIQLCAQCETTALPSFYLSCKLLYEKCYWLLECQNRKEQCTLHCNAVTRKVPFTVFLETQTIELYRACNARSKLIFDVLCNIVFLFKFVLLYCCFLSFLTFLCFQHLNILFSYNIYLNTITIIYIAILLPVFFHRILMVPTTSKKFIDPRCNQTRANKTPPVKKHQCL